VLSLVKQLRQLTEATVTGASLGDLLRSPVVGHPDEPAGGRGAAHGRNRLYSVPVVDSDTGQLAGMISLHDLLLARVRNLNEERHRERVLATTASVREPCQPGA